MSEIRQVAPDKPIFFLELGMPDNTKKDSPRAAEKIRLIFHEIIDKYPEIHGFSMWSFHPLWENPDAPDYFPFDCLVRPGTAQVTAFKKVIHRHPNAFHSCVYFSDRGGMPSCAPAISFPAVKITSRPIAA